MPLIDFMRARYRRLPLTGRLPLMVALMIFAASLGTTQAALQVVSRQFEQQMSGIGQVYLDGVLAALLPVLSEGDTAAVSGVLERSLAVSVGVQERSLAVLDTQGRLMARADRPGRLWISP